MGELLQVRLRNVLWLLVVGGQSVCRPRVPPERPWVPGSTGHECIVARVSAIGDPLKNQDEWKPVEDRHVAQRNVAVVNSTLHLGNLLKTLEASKLTNSTTRLFQIGVEAAQAVKIVAPHLSIDTAVRTHLLAELRPTGDLVIPPITNRPPIILPHAVLNLGAAPSGTTGKLKANVRLDQNIPLHDNATVADLLGHGNFLPRNVLSKISILPPPKKAEAQVLRIVNYKDGMPVGGCTIIITA